MFPVDELLPLLVLALGAAMAVGSALALVRPPERSEAAAEEDGDLVRAPIARSAVMIVVGVVAAVWAVASLVSS